MEQYLVITKSIFTPKFRKYATIISQEFEDDLVYYWIEQPKPTDIMGAVNHQPFNLPLRYCAIAIINLTNGEVLKNRDPERFKFND